MIDTLPNLPSEILEVALRDLEVVEKMPGFKINMNMWVTKRGVYCEVCHAGAVMINSLKIEVDKLTTYINNPYTLTNDTLAAKLFFIDDIRRGWINQGLRKLEHAKIILPIKDRHLISNFAPSDDAKFYFEDHREEYKGYIRQVISYLKEKDL